MTDNITVNVTPPNKLAARFDLARSIVMSVYTAFMAWEMAKAICPPLAVHEKILITNLSRRLPRKAPSLTDRQINDYVAEVTKFVREADDG